MKKKTDMKKSKTELSIILEPFKHRLETDSDLALLFEDVVDFCIYKSKRAYTHGYNKDLEKFRRIKWGKPQKEELRTFIRDAVTGTKNHSTKVSMMLILSKFEGERDVELFQSILKGALVETQTHYRILSQALIALSNAGEDSISKGSFDIFEIEKNIGDARKYLAGDSYLS